MTALALREDQDYWDEKQLAVLRQTGIGDQVTPAELAAFLHLCQRTGLDPFARQIYLIGRWDSKAGREVFRPQTGIDGYRIVAQRTVERTKQSFGYEDSLWCGADGQWTDVWLSPDPPAAAKVTVLRDGKRFPAIARWSEYVPLNRDGKPTGLWVKRHAAQLEKCAESLALRKAFPNDMAGVYTAEEMEQADNPPVVTATAEVVRDEPPQQDSPPPQDAPQGDPWYVHPVPETEAAEQWVAAMLRLVPDAGLDACRGYWREAAEKGNTGEVSKAEAETVLTALKARMEALATPAQDAEAAPVTEGEPIEGVIVPDLPDDWRDKIADIQGGADGDAVIEEAHRLLSTRVLDQDHFTRISDAVTERIAEIAGRQKVAAYSGGGGDPADVIDGYSGQLL